MLTRNAWTRRFIFGGPSRKSNRRRKGLSCEQDRTSRVPGDAHRPKPGRHSRLPLGPEPRGVLVDSTPADWVPANRQGDVARAGHRGLHLSRVAPGGETGLGFGPMTKDPVKLALRKARHNERTRNRYRDL